MPVTKVTEEENNQGMVIIMIVATGVDVEGNMAEMMNMGEDEDDKDHDDWGDKEDWDEDDWEDKDFVSLTGKFINFVSL